MITLTSTGLIHTADENRWNDVDKILNIPDDAPGYYNDIVRSLRRSPKHRSQLAMEFDRKPEVIGCTLNELKRLGRIRKKDVVARDGALGGPLVIRWEAI